MLHDDISFIIHSIQVKGTKTSVSFFLVLEIMKLYS